MNEDAGKEEEKDRQEEMEEQEEERKEGIEEEEGTALRHQAFFVSFSFFFLISISQKSYKEAFLSSSRFLFVCVVCLFLSANSGVRFWCDYTRRSFT